MARCFLQTHLAIVLGSLLAASLSLAADFSGLVVSVLDGDTIEVLHNDHPEHIRINGIDCPKKDQACGTQAKQAASKLVLGGEVTFQTYGKDKYGRTIADVLLLDGTNVNHTLVEDGWCWWYRKYVPGDTSNSTRKTVVLRLHRLQIASVPDALCISRTQF